MPLFLKSSNIYQSFQGFFYQKKNKRTSVNIESVYRLGHQNILHKYRKNIFNKKIY